MVRPPASARELPVLQSPQTGSGKHSASYSTLDCSPGLKWPGCEADHSPPPSDEVKNECLHSLLGLHSAHRDSENSTVCIKHRLDRITQDVVSILVLSFTMGIGSFPRAKRSGCGVNHLPPSTVEVKGKVEI
jgi:hypothetical protein